MKFLRLFFRRKYPVSEAQYFDVVMEDDVTAEMPVWSVPIAPKIAPLRTPVIKPLSVPPPPDVDPEEWEDDE